MKLPLSHDLPIYLNECPFYDSLPGRIADFIRARDGRMNCIDVGANVGDTIAALHRHEKDVFLAIEPNLGFRRFLVENWGSSRNVTVLPHICSAAREEGLFAFREKSGTASLRTGEGAPSTAKPLDEIVTEHPLAAECNFLKIDTDGHDFKVLAGAQGLISGRRPAVLFECDDFGSATYVQECLAAFDWFSTVGYREFLVYSNTGCLMGWHSLSERTHFRNLLFYQLTGDFCYFDILLMRPEDLKAFHRTELAFFADKLPNASMKTMALKVASPIPE